MGTIDRGFHLLPVELLAAILLRCVPYPSRNDPGPLLSRKHPAIVLSHVCHDWRQIALGTPLLWSRMHIETPRPFNSEIQSLEQWRRNCEAVREAIAVWMERSTGCPLTIVFDVHGKYEPSGAEYHTSVINDVVRSSKRWRELQVTIGCDLFALRSLERATQDLSADDLPMLASLSMTLNLPHMNMPNILTSFSNILMESRLLAGTKLRQVTLGGNWNMAAGLNGYLHQRWAPLTELTIDLCRLHQIYSRFHAHNALYLLKSFPQLVKVSFKFVFKYPEINRSYASYIPFTLPHLQSLSLRGIPPVAEFARSLILPSLNAMYLVFDAYDDIDHNVQVLKPPTYGEGIVEFLRQFGSQVIALALNPEPLTLESFPSCLDYLNSQRLETLSLIDKHFPSPPSALNFDSEPDSVGHAALIYLANSSVLPNLKNFEMTLRNWLWGEWSERALVKVIFARRRHNWHGCDEYVLRNEDGVAVDFQVCVGDEDAADSSGIPRSRLRRAHIAFSLPSTINIIDELKHRRVDLDGEPFSLILDYPKSREVVGRVSEGIWEEWR